MDGVSSASGIGFMLDYSVSVTKKAMDTTEVIAANMIEMLEEAAPTPVAPAKGQYIDILV